MVLASLKSPQRAVYHQQLIVTLKELVEPVTFLQAARICLSRHAGFMAQFLLPEGELFQRRLKIECPASELRDVTHLDMFLAEDGPLPLARNQPAWRSTFLQLPSDQQVWVWTFHHAICDGVSEIPLLNEVFVAYDEIRAGHEPSCEPVRPDMLDHLDWLEKQDWEWAKAEWRSRISPSETVTQLPEVRGFFESSVPATQALRRETVRIDAEMRAALDRLIVESEVTANTVVVGALALTLGRLRSESRVIFAAMREARQSSITGAESIAGSLTNTLPICLDLPENISVAEWLRQIRRQWVALRTLEQCSLAQIMEWTGLEIGADTLPILLDFRRATLDARVQATGLSERCAVELRQANDLVLMIGGYEKPALELEVVWRGDRVPAAIAQLIARTLEFALRSFAQDPHQTLGQLELVNEEQRATIEMAALTSHQLAVRPFAHALIEEQISKQPNTPALVSCSRLMNYGELSLLADRVASVVRDGEIVAVVMPPGPEIAAVMLGLLRRGSVFFLLNPETPQTERALMLGRLQIRTAIVLDSFANAMKRHVPEVVRFSEIEQLTINGSRASGEIKPSDLAYIVHTSGSTGEKKFVEVEHHSLAHALGALVDLFGIVPGDRRIARASPGTDYFISEILVTLSGGGAVVFPNSAGALTITEFTAEMRRERITVTGIPASYWHEWVRQMNENNELPRDLRLVITGMERVDPVALAKWRKLFGDRVRLLNVYGPAETTLIATAYESSEADEADPIHVRIGRPVASAAVRVLDHGLRRLPPGVVGELCIGGTGVGRGYRDDEHATRSQFVADPFDSRNGARLYRTGDYGYLDSAGYFVFVGRRDQQVKIRGHRVELGEIEVALQRNDSVRQAVCTMMPHGDDGWLVAHIVPEQTFSETELRAWLKTHLPAHMRPAEVAVLDEIPMLRSGKVDRDALSKAHAERIAQQNSGAGCPAGSGKLEQLWQELFGRHHQILPTDNFFDCGGDSLKAVQLLAGIEKEFGVSLSLQDLFVHPTIVGQRALIECGGTASNYTSLSRLNETKSGRPLVILHGWGGGFFHTIHFALRLDRPVYGLQAIEHVGKSRHESVEEMAAHYADEMMREFGNGPTDLLGHSVGGVIAYATACALAQRRHCVGKLFIVDTIPSNLPKWVHLKFLAPYIRARIPFHTRTLLRTPPQHWLQFIRARGRSWKELMKKRRALDQPKSSPQHYDYYCDLAEKFVPECREFDVRLLTASDDPIEIYWRYLVGENVRVVPVHSGHVDMFTQKHLDEFITAFYAADEGANSINQKPSSILRA
jgi:amino acid adenylation domain-containing protein